MPPMTNVKTFIAALRTGETRTTLALDKAVARRRSPRAAALIALLAKPGALKTPLQDDLRAAVREARLPERYIEHCVDGWPDRQKEQIRRAIATAIRGGHRVRFEWGLTPAGSHETQITRAKSGAVRILALTPRSSLKVSAKGDIEAMPLSRRRTAVAASSRSKS